MVAQTVWIARHGARADVKNGKWLRSDDRTMDPPLSSLGVEQAEELARCLASEGICHIFASPYLRTIQTAQPVSERLGISIKVEHGIGECLWDAPTVPTELLSLAELMQRFTGIDGGYVSKRQPPRGPEPEPRAKVRAGETIREIADAYDGNILVIGHGITVLGGVRALIGGHEPIQASFCSLSAAERVGSNWELKENGSIAHLSDPEGSLQHTVRE